MKPMKAHKWKERKSSLPRYVQYKYNGIRATWDPAMDVLSSSDEILWHNDRLPNIHENLRLFFRNMRVDGELYCHGKSLQDINSRVAVKSKATHTDIDSISFYLFDIIDYAPMRERFDMMLRLKQDIPFIRIVPTFFCTDHDFADMFHAQAVADGYEGSMYRDIDAPYGFPNDCTNQENRWDYVLKRKDFEHEDCEIVATNEGTKGLEGLVGSFTLVFPNGRHFNAGSGLTMVQRKIFYYQSAIGLKCRVRYQYLTDDLVPYLPTIEAVLQ